MREPGISSLKPPLERKKVSLSTSTPAVVLLPSPSTLATLSRGLEFRVVGFGVALLWCLEGARASGFWPLIGFQGSWWHGFHAEGSVGCGAEGPLTA